MKAGLRFGITAFAAGLALGPAAALAQSAGQPATNSATTNTPAADTIGPRELQDFSLNGTVTRPAEPAAQVPPARPQPRAPGTQSASSRDSPQAPASARPPRAQAPAPAAGADAGRSLALDLPATAAGGAALASSPPPPAFTPAADTAPATLAPEQTLSLWPWLLLAAVAIGAGLLLWRRRSRLAYAGGAADAYVAPEPSPPPRPAPAPQPAPTPAPPAAGVPAGIVSTRLRPWLEIGFVPIGCSVDDQQVRVEFEVEIFNSGSAPARDILVEASLFNAGATQERDLGAFFAKPAGAGERIETLPPLQRMTIRSALVAPRANIQQFELGGRQVFVPVVAFNALYRWTGGGGQSAVSYLLGRETKSDKLGPLRADLGPRTFDGLGVRLLPIGIRT